MILTEDEVFQLLKLIEESSFDELNLETEDLKLIVRRGSNKTTYIEAYESKSSDEPKLIQRSFLETRETEKQAKDSRIENKVWVPPEGEFEVVKSPMLGIFYRCPSPGAPPYVEVGDFVKEEDTICLIEVMKVFNAVKAGIKGIISKIFVESGQLVEYGQPLFMIKPVEIIGGRKKKEI